GTTRPSSTTSSGSGSFGPSSATRPRSGHGETSTSLRTSRASRATSRSDLRGASLIGREQASLLVCLQGLTDEGRGPRRRVFVFEPRGEILQLARGRAPRTQRRVDVE